LIRNKLFPWSRKAFTLSSVRDIQFESIPRRANTLRVTTNDFQSFRFGAASISNKTWKALQERLEKSHLAVRNDIIV